MHGIDNDPSKVPTLGKVATTPLRFLVLSIALLAALVANSWPRGDQTTVSRLYHVNQSEVRGRSSSSVISGIA